MIVVGVRMEGDQRDGSVSAPRSVASLPVLAAVRCQGINLCETFVRAAMSGPQSPTEFQPEVAYAVKSPLQMQI